MQLLMSLPVHHNQTQLAAHQQVSKPSYTPNSNPSLYNYMHKLTNFYNKKGHRGPLISHLLPCNYHHSAATSTVTVVVSSPRPSSTESAAAGLDDCIVYMGGAAGAIFVVTTLVMCLFSCIIACLCHKHKMKTFKINMKKQMHSKWEY